MTDSAPPPSTPTGHKSTLTSGQKVFLRVSGVVAMVLFLLPTFYVAKYFALDSPRETKLVAQAQSAIKAHRRVLMMPDITPDEIPEAMEIARHGVSVGDRIDAVRRVGAELQKISVNFERPMECVQAKSGLADIAASDPNPDVRSAAQDEIGKIAQGGVLVRR